MSISVQLSTVVFFFRDLRTAISKVLLNTCGTFPEYATVCNLLGGQTPGANPPLESLELQSDGILMVTCSWPHLTVEAEKFPAGVPRDEDKQCHQQWVRSWMDDGCICKDNKQMNHDPSDIHLLKLRTYLDGNMDMSDMYHLFCMKWT
jgi:hypothetical protein